MCSAATGKHICTGEHGSTIGMQCDDEQGNQKVLLTARNEWADPDSFDEIRFRSGRTATCHLWRRVLSVMAHAAARGIPVPFSIKL